MSKGLFGYGRYPDGHVGCPRAKTDMTPCVARDGHLAEYIDDERRTFCVGCEQGTASLLVELVKSCSENTQTGKP